MVASCAPSRVLILADAQVPNAADHDAQDDQEHEDADIV